MSGSHHFFPLAIVTPKNLARLCEALWDWSPCVNWIEGETCYTSGCFCRRANRLEPFFDFYGDATAYYLPDVVVDSHPALRSHDDLADIIVLLRYNSERPRSQLTKEYFDLRLRITHQVPLPSDQNRAFNLAVRILATVQSSAENQSDGLLEAGVQPVTWHSDQSLAKFLTSVFPKRGHPALSPIDDVSLSARIHLSSITAKRLKKVAGLEIIPTSNLGDHLLLDEKNGTVAIFHCTSVLKEFLDASSTKITDKTPKSNPRAGICPELALETLATLKEVLFPDDAASQSTLRSLVSKQKFDPDIIRVVDSPSYRSGLGGPISYDYWGSRLMDLHEELESPTPRGIMEKWFERKSGARYAMMATLVGVVIAVILGLFGLAVSIFQAWIGWQQWQHPVTSR